MKLEWFGTYNEEPWVGLKDKVIISCDTAMSGSELSSYSACVVGIVQGESVYIVEVFRDRLQFPALRRKVMEIYLKWRGQARNCSLLIENKGSGMSLIQQLRRYGGHCDPA